MRFSREFQAVFVKMAASKDGKTVKSSNNAAQVRCNEGWQRMNWRGAYWVIMLCVAAALVTGCHGDPNVRKHKYLESGKKYEAAGKYREAIAELDEAIKLQPDLAMAYNARGFTRYLMHDYAKAIADFDEAIRLQPGYVNAVSNRNLALNAAKSHPK